jgi:hypothetical protein
MTYQLDITEYKKRDNIPPVLKDFPDIILIKDGQYGKKYDVVESSIPKKVLKKHRKWLLDNYSYFIDYDVAKNRPMGLNNIPEGVKLIPVKNDTTNIKNK